MFQKLKLFFIKPAELFREYIDKPTWALKLIIISIISGLYAYGTKVLGEDLIIEMMEEKAAAMSPEQAEAMRASIALMNTPVMNAVSAVVGVVSMIAVILLVSAVYMAFIRAFKGKIKYRQILSVYTLAYMVTAVGLVVKLAYMYFTGNLLYINMSPTYWDILYNNLDLFIIWQSILMVFGISAVSGIPEKKSTIIVVSMWFVSLFISLGSMMLAK
jgi:hypothetical protein